MRAPIHLIAPLACDRPDDVRRYTAMLRAGKRAPAIWISKQPPGSRYPYRILDGAHRVRAARRAGRKTIEARIIVYE
jgi:ParB-like chromosome segregation protein Spo0J